MSSEFKNLRNNITSNPYFGLFNWWAYICVFILICLLPLSSQLDDGVPNGYSSDMDWFVVVTVVSVMVAYLVFRTRLQKSISNVKDTLKTMVPQNGDGIAYLNEIISESKNDTFMKNFVSLLAWASTAAIAIQTAYIAFSNNKVTQTVTAIGVVSQKKLKIEGLQELQSELMHSMELTAELVTVIVAICIVIICLILLQSMSKNTIVRTATRELKYEMLAAQNHK